VGGVELDHFPVEEETCVLGHARGLLHVVRHDDDSVLALELEDEVFDLRGGDGVECRGWLVHEEDFGINGEGTRDAHALLLATGEAGAGLLLEVVFDLFPESGLLEGALYGFVEDTAVAKAVELEAADDIVVDGHRREGVGALEDHAYAAADLDGRSVTIDVDLAHFDNTGGMGDGVGLVHAIEATNEGGFAAAGGADERGGVVRGDMQVNVLQCVVRTIPCVQIFN